MEVAPVYEDGTPMPRCQYCGEFFTGYPGNQICDDCHEHIVGMEKEVAALTAELDTRDADVRRLVEFVEQWDKEQVMTDFAITRSGKDGWIAMRDARASVESIIERVRESEG